MADKMFAYVPGTPPPTQPGQAGAKPTPTQDKYFACADAKDVGDKIWGHFRTLVNREHPMSPMWLAALNHYYGTASLAGRTWAVSRRGEEGELAAIRVNRIRSMSKTRQALITAARVEWEPVADNSSAGAAYATTLSRILLEHWYKRAGIAEHFIRWVEMSEVLTEAHSFTEWDTTRGSDLCVIENQLQRAGECRTHLLPPWRIVTDSTRMAAEQQDWWFVMLDKPKADLCGKYQALADGRQGELAQEAIWGARYEWLDGNQRLDDYTLTHDLAPEIHFIHRPTVTLPQGRHVVMCNGSVVLRDTPLVGPAGDYMAVPIVRLAADEYIDSPFGWSSFLDACGPQEILDAADTTRATIVTSFGNPSLMAETGTDLNVDDVVKGFRPIYMPPGSKPPEFLQMPELSEPTMKWTESIVGDQERMMGLNDAALGNTGTEKNAQADALAASMAVQQAGSAVMASRKALGKLGFIYLTTISKNIGEAQVSEIVGAGDVNLLGDVKTWTGSQLGPIKAVDIGEKSPLESTEQGRYALGEQFIQLGFIKTPQDLTEVRTTGRLDSMLTPERDEQQLIKTENELIARGQTPKTIHPTQNHVFHYQKHADVLLSPTALGDVATLKACHAHLDAHYAAYFNIDPHQDPQEPQRRRFLLGQGAEPAPMPPHALGAGTPPTSGPTGAPAGQLNLPAGAPNIKPANNPMTGSPVSTTQPPLS